jgi:arylsulfatase A-like enzyme
MVTALTLTRVLVAFLVLDGLPVRHVGPRVTAKLWALARDGGHAGVGQGVMTSSTYPNHATFATGVAPVRHGILGNWVVTDAGPRPAHTVGPRAPTIFEVCHRAGRSSAAVFGDHHLIGVMAGSAADLHWPPNGELPEDAARDAHGYAADRAVLPKLSDALAGEFDLVVGHLNEPDTAGHVYGPDSDEATDAYRATDAVLGQLIDEVRTRWSDAVVIVVSDHGQETVSDEAPIDLYAAVDEAGLSLVVVPEGGAAVIWGEDATGGRWLTDVGGVGGHEEVDHGCRVVWAAVGREFALPPGIEIPPQLGQHGGVSTLEQVAVVGGGHSAAARLARKLAVRKLNGADWAPTICDLLDVELPTATGVSLLR